MVLWLQTSGSWISFAMRWRLNACGAIALPFDFRSLGAGIEFGLQGHPAPVAGASRRTSMDRHAHSPAWRGALG